MLFPAFLRGFFFVNMSRLNKLLSVQDVINKSLISINKEIGELQTLMSNNAASLSLNSGIQKENARLEELIKITKDELVHLELLRGIKQIAVPSKESFTSVHMNGTETSNDVISPIKTKSGEVSQDDNAPIKPKPSQVKEPKKKVKPEKVQPKPETSGPVDVSRLDLRVGCIVDIKKHPDADSLYISQIDVGQQKPLNVISGLVKHFTEKELLGRSVVLLCNLKPAKMRGVLSEAMVMCASTPDKVETLIPPAGAVPGDLVQVDGYERNPDAVLNPKHKIFEAVAVDLKTNSECQACYKGSVWSVPGKGIVTSKQLSNVNIK